MKIKVYILDNGVLECDENWMVAMSVVGTRSAPTPKTRWIRIPVYAVLVDHPDGKILYDTGCPPNAMSGYWPAGLCEVFPYSFTPAQGFVEQLALAGARPEEIKTVVISHLHLDHAGNVGLFKHAEVCVHRREFEHAHSVVRADPDPTTHGAYVRADMEIQPRRFRLVEGDCELAAGVELIWLPGHTPGLLGLVVRTERSGTLIFPQDALYTRRNYGPPARVSGIIHDSLSFFHSVEKIRALAARRNGRVMFSHDIEFFQTLKRAPEYYD
jgi:glyoxylase-like metal-dependent hydrolase (beta-lactamase superfamily II)